MRSIAFTCVLYQSRSFDLNLKSILIVWPWSVEKGRLDARDSRAFLVAAGDMRCKRSSRLSRHETTKERSHQPFHLSLLMGKGSYLYSFAKEDLATVATKPELARFSALKVLVKELIL